MHQSKAYCAWNIWLILGIHRSCTIYIAYVIRSTYEYLWVLIWPLHHSLHFWITLDTMGINIIFWSTSLFWENRYIPIRIKYNNSYPYSSVIDSFILFNLCNEIIFQSCCISTIWRSKLIQLVVAKATSFRLWPCRPPT